MRVLFQAVGALGGRVGARFGVAGMSSTGLMSTMPAPAKSTQASITRGIRQVASCSSSAFAAAVASSSFLASSTASAAMPAQLSVVQPFSSSTSLGAQGGGGGGGGGGGVEGRRGERTQSWQPSLASSLSKVRALVYSENGPPESVLRMAEAHPLPEVGHGQVLVKVLAAPINPSDINQIEGTYPNRPPLPAVGGNEGVGVVTDVGAGVKNLKVDDLVVAARYGLGTWREQLVCEEDDLIQVLPDSPLEYAATVVVNPTTAYRMLEDFVNLVEGDVVVQNGATSMVGQAVIQLANVKGVRTINIIRDRPDLAETVRNLQDLGATVVVTEEQAEDRSIMKHVMGDLPPPVLGLNCVGGSSASSILKVLAPGGTIVTYGGMAKKPVTVSASQLIFKDVIVRGFWVSRWVELHSKEERLEMINHLLQLAKDEKLKLQIEKVPFAEYQGALEKALGKRGHSKAKQLLRGCSKAKQLLVME
ncbi:hypothetical protein CBR_g29478 [Chara braunii]|uniref:Enoyl-[acyl-carrier-protein] reductase, mitochondrial n=1 Tax=Chara braunii TaxID=69332 RepID=A0A388LAJ0_CHABU|nr:hypothetical protein CBR_g29478 [Chara braunii]|eukprot:GBG79328.1 hypothetical protein CBR_g29478 [Chara braunii]